MGRPQKHKQLPAEAVLRIRKIMGLRRALPTRRDLAREYGIHPGSVDRIAMGVWYKRIRENVDIEALAKELERNVDVSG